MKRVFTNAHVKRLLSAIAAIEVLELMTRPPGSALSPTEGFTGSFGEAS